MNLNSKDLEIIMKELVNLHQTNQLTDIELYNKTKIFEIDTKIDITEYVDDIDFSIFICSILICFVFFMVIPSMFIKIYINSVTTMFSTFIILGISLVIGLVKLSKFILKYELYLYKNIEKVNRKKIDDEYKIKLDNLNKKIFN